MDRCVIFIMLISMHLCLYMFFCSPSCNNSCRLNGYRFLECIKLLPIILNLSNVLFADSHPWNHINNTSGLILNVAYFFLPMKCQPLADCWRTYHSNAGKSSHIKHVTFPECKSEGVKYG